MSDLVKQARLAQHDDRMSTGALYRDLADRIEELEAQLTAMTAERDKYESGWLEAEGKLSDVDALVKTLTDDPDYTAAYLAGVASVKAAIPRAYAMGVEAAAREASKGSFADGHFIHRHQKAKAIRALTPPADLVERVLKTKGNENE